MPGDMPWIYGFLQPYENWRDSMFFLFCFVSGRNVHKTPSVATIQEMGQRFLTRNNRVCEIFFPSVRIISQSKDILRFLVQKYYHLFFKWKKSSLLLKYSVVLKQKLPIKCWFSNKGVAILLILKRDACFNLYIYIYILSWFCKDQVLFWQFLSFMLTSWKCVHVQKCPCV